MAFVAAEGPGCVVHARLDVPSSAVAGVPGFGLKGLGFRVWGLGFRV